MSYIIRAKDLKEFYNDGSDSNNDYRTIENLDDVTLIPVLDVAFHGWMDFLKENPFISDIRKDQGDDISTYWKYTCVAVGKMINIVGMPENVSIYNGNDMRQMIASIHVGEDDELSKVVASGFPTYVKARGLGALIDEAKINLQSGWKAHLLPGIQEFYLNQNE